MDTKRRASCPPNMESPRSLLACQPAVMLNEASPALGQQLEIKHATHVNMLLACGGSGPWRRRRRSACAACRWRCRRRTRPAMPAASGASCSPRAPGRCTRKSFPVKSAFCKCPIPQMPVRIVLLGPCSGCMSVPSCVLDYYWGRHPSRAARHAHRAARVPLDADTCLLPLCAEASQCTVTSERRCCTGPAPVPTVRLQLGQW